MPIKYKLMMSDRIRTLAYKNAIMECVRKNDTVADVGTGLGILALFAARSGARKVYAIEQSSDIIKHAKSVVDDNGFGNKIIFVKGLSSGIDLPEKVDVIVSETLGTMGIEENTVESLYDARKRFLKKSGIVIPSSIDLYIAPIESDQIFKKTAGYFTRDYYGFDFSGLNDSSVSRIYVETLKPHFLLAQPEEIVSFNPTMRTPVFKRSLNLKMKRNGILHGFAIWFVARLSSKIELTNSPLSKPTHWQQAFLPIRNPLPVKRGQKISVSISNRLVHQRIVWEWEVRTRNNKFTYSTLKTVPPKRILTDMNFYQHKPVLSEDAKINSLILRLCDGKRTTEEIAAVVHNMYPGKFKMPLQAVEKVAGLLLHS